VNDLEQAVQVFAQLTTRLADVNLERAWVWGEYDEGVRFAFFRTYEGLCTLAARLAAERSSVQPLTIAQRLLGQYHTAYRELQAVLLGVCDTQAAQPPAENEWPLRTTLLHMVEAERAFFAITNYSIARERAQDGHAMEMSDEDWEAFWAGDPFQQLKDNGAFSDILVYYDQLHQRVLDHLTGVAEHELEAPVVFWESQPMPVQFRLVRFTSHLRQHTIQMEKALTTLNLGPNESKRLLHLIYMALAEVEGSLLGAPDLGASACQALADEIYARSEEIAEALK
jgi:hypothetical protein